MREGAVVLVATNAADGVYLTVEEIVATTSWSTNTVYRRAWSDGWRKTKTKPVRYLACDVMASVPPGSTRPRNHLIRKYLDRPLN